MYAYWQSGLTLTKIQGEVDVPVEIPANLVAEEYSLVDDEGNGASLLVGFDNNDVYIQGLCSYLPNAWVKGTRNGNQVTFKTGQMFGAYGTSYTMWFLGYSTTTGVTDLVFNYDEVTNTFTTTGWILVNLDKTDIASGNNVVTIYSAPVIKKVIEKAATPANPEITALNNGDYGYYIVFNVPNVDTEGDGMVSSKLFYEIFTDVEHNVQPLTFTPATHTRLTENLTEIPYGFTENWDFYDGEIYLNELYSADWNKIGIKSIYTGGDETHETEIQWYTIKKYALAAEYSIDPAEGTVQSLKDFAIDFTAYQVAVTASASAKLVNTATNDEVNGALSVDAAGTLVTITLDSEVTAPADYQLIVAAGSLTNTTSNQTLPELTFNYTIEAEPEPVAAPENLTTETYLFKSIAVEYDEDTDETQFEDYELQVQVGFDGDDLYIQGLCQDVPEYWVKATKNAAGQYVIPANQYMGTWDVGGYGMWIYDYYFTAVDEAGALVDVVLNYNAETSTFTTDQLLALNGEKNSLYYYLLFDGATITKLVEVAATPADPTVLAFNVDSSYPNVQFEIPAVGTNGETLLTSKLFYTIWIVKDGEQQQLTLTPADYEALTENMTEIPYTFDDDWDIYSGGSRVYLNQSDVAEWTNIGVQSIYTGGGETNKSKLVWLHEVITGITTVATDSSNDRYYDLQGRLAEPTAKGLLIKQVTDAQGNVLNVKVVRK